MINFTPSQNRMVAAGLTVAAFAVVLAFVVFIGAVAAKFFAFASPALVPVVGGLFLSMLFKPYYNMLLRRLKNPTLAFTVMLLSVMIPLIAFCWFGGAFVTRQILNLSKTAPQIIVRTSDWVNLQYPNAQSLISQFGAAPNHLPMMFLTDPLRFSTELFATIGSEYGADAVKAGFSVLKYLLKVGQFLVMLVFFAYFLTRPEMRGCDYVREMAFLKEDTRRFVAQQIDAFLGILVSFFRRQVVICLIEGLYYGVGFMLVGLPYGFIIGFALGALNLVPLLGTVTCLPLALPLAYFGDGGSLCAMFGVLGVWLLGQILDGYLITPKIQGDKTGLGYAGVIFSFFFWGVVFGSFFGLLMAIPLSAFCVVLWRALKASYIKGII